jgi:hypothetical protein
VTARSTRGRCALLAAPAATLLLAACGGGSNGDNPAADQPNDAKRLAFAACLRRAGVEVTDQTGRGGFDIRAPRGISRARMDRIERDCARTTGGGPGGGRQATPQEKARFLDQALAFARCMRAHGVDMMDPKPDRHGIQIEIKGSSGEPNSPVFRQAQGACGSLNPKGKSRSASGKK